MGEHKTSCGREAWAITNDDKMGEIVGNCRCGRWGGDLKCVLFIKEHLRVDPFTE